MLEFRSNNTAHRPVVEALALIRRYANAGNTTYYPPGEHVPAHPGVGGDWQELVHRANTSGRARVARMPYEVGTFQVLRDRLRCKEIWVVGAGRWRNPDEDLPADFDTRRTEHYASLRKPLDAAAFLDPLREEMRAELAALHDALPNADWLRIADRPAGAIGLTPLPHRLATSPLSRRRFRGSGIASSDRLQAAGAQYRLLQACRSAARPQSPGAAPYRRMCSRSG